MGQLTSNELKQQYLTTDNGIFTPLYTSDAPVPILDTNEQITDFELPNFKLIKTAEQVHQEWKDAKANPPAPQPTEAERLASAEKAIAILMGV